MCGLCVDSVSRVVDWGSMLMLIVYGQGDYERILRLVGRGSALGGSRNLMPERRCLGKVDLRIVLSREHPLASGYASVQTGHRDCLPMPEPASEIVTAYALICLECQQRYMTASKVITFQFVWATVRTLYHHSSRHSHNIPPTILMHMHIVQRQMVALLA